MATADKNLSLPALLPASRTSLRAGLLGSAVRPVHCRASSTSRGSVSGLPAGPRSSGAGSQPASCRERVPRDITPSLADYLQQQADE
jgi:hypothetical protein